VEKLIESSRRLLELIFSYELGSTNFYTLLAACFLIWIAVVWGLLRSWGRQLSLIPSALSVLLPALSAIPSFAAVEVYAVPAIGQGWAAAYLPWGGFVLGYLVVAVLISRKLLKLSVSGTLALLAFTFLAAGLTYLATSQLLGMVDQAEQSGEQREQRLVDQVGE